MAAATRNPPPRVLGRLGVLSGTCSRAQPRIEARQPPRSEVGRRVDRRVSRSRNCLLFLMPGFGNTDLGSYDLTILDLTTSTDLTIKTRADTATKKKINFLAAADR